MATSVSVPIDQRFAQLIQQFGLTKNSFAISLGKTASVVQHLIDGRNKPGFDLLCKVFEIYPNVSRDWLLLGRGPMLVGGGPAPARPAPAPLAYAPELPLQLSDLEPIEVPPARRPAAHAVGGGLQPAEISAALALAAAQPARAATAQKPEEPAAASPAAPASAAAPAAVPPGAAAALLESAPERPAAPPAAPAPFAPEAYLAGALHAQHLLHQLALAELRNQHLLEQQGLLRELLEMARR